MEAKSFLQQYATIMTKIQVIEEELADLREARSSIAIKLDGMPRGSNLSDPTARLAIQLADLEAELIEMQSRSWTIRMQILDVIGTLENPDHMKVLHLRYIKRKRWWQIAGTMHYSYQWVSGPLHKSAIQEVEKIMEDRHDKRLYSTEQ